MGVQQSAVRGSSAKSLLASGALPGIERGRGADRRLPERTLLESRLCVLVLFHGAACDRCALHLLAGARAGVVRRTSGRHRSYRAGAESLRSIRALHVRRVDDSGEYRVARPRAPARGLWRWLLPVLSIASHPAIYEILEGIAAMVMAPNSARRIWTRRAISGTRKGYGAGDAQCRARDGGGARLPAG